MDKKPFLAAVLNVIAPGWGYLYLGVKKTFAGLVLASVLISYFLLLFVELTNLQDGNGDILADSLALVAFVCFYVAFGLDGYREAQKLKRTVEK